MKQEIQEETPAWRLMLHGLFPILDENHSQGLAAAEIIEAFLENDVSTFILRNKLNVGEHASPDKCAIHSAINSFASCDTSSLAAVPAHVLPCTLRRLLARFSSRKRAQISDAMYSDKKTQSENVELWDQKMNENDFRKYVQEIMLMKNEMDFDVIIHSHVEWVKEFDATGVHLTAKSMSISDARKILGPYKIIGYSAHSIEEVKNAKSMGADYVFLGAIFDTPKKHANHPILGLETLREACQLGIPVYAIGGITAKNLTDIKKAGAQGFSALRALYANHDVEHNVSKLQILWHESF